MDRIPPHCVHFGLDSAFLLRSLLDDLAVLFFAPFLGTTAFLNSAPFFSVVAVSFPAADAFLCCAVLAVVAAFRFDAAFLGAATFLDATSFFVVGASLEPLCCLDGGLLGSDFLDSSFGRRPVSVAFRAD